MLYGHKIESTELKIFSGGQLTNAGDGLAARARAKAKPSEKSMWTPKKGLASKNVLDLTLDGDVRNTALGVLGDGTATQTIGEIDGSVRASGNKIQNYVQKEGDKRRRRGSSASALQRRKSV